MNLWLQGGGEGIVRELEIDLYTLVYLKWITNKNLLYRQGLCWILCNNQHRKRTWERTDVCICTDITELLCCPPETNTTLLINYTPIQNKKFKKREDFTCSFTNASYHEPDPQNCSVKELTCLWGGAEVPSATGRCVPFAPWSQTLFISVPLFISAPFPWPLLTMASPASVWSLSLASSLCLWSALSSLHLSSWRVSVVDSLSVGQHLVWSRGRMMWSDAVWALVRALFGVQILSPPPLPPAVVRFLPGLQLTSQVGEVIGNLVPAYILFSICFWGTF